MKSVFDYPVKWGFGITAPAPWSPTHPHLGVDREAPYGTPLIVNGKLLGRSGNTGGVQAHHHLQKVVNGKVVNPGNGGGTIALPAVVFAVDTVDDTNIGKNIRIRDAHGVEWSHFHLSEILVKVGDIIEEKPMNDIFNEGDRVNVNYHLYGKDMGYHKDQINKTYKQARESIDTSPEFKAEQYFNSGDAVNIDYKTGRKDAKTQIGKLWKDVGYNYLAQPSDFIRISEPVFKRRK